MARVTVEDCITIIPNRFELVLLASQRARDIAAGVDLTVDRDNDKNAVVSLREIAEQSIDFEQLRTHIVRGVNRHADLNLEDDNLMALTQEFLPDAENVFSKGSAEIEEVSFEEVGAEEEVDASDAEDEMDSEDAVEPTEEDIAMASEDVLDEGSL